MRKLIDKLAENHSLVTGEYLKIIKNATSSDAEYLASLARAEKEKHYGKEVFIRGLIEVSNICKNDCYYCGIRKTASDTASAKTTFWSAARPDMK